jgi:hypothetical protein
LRIPEGVLESAIRRLSRIGWLGVAFVGRSDPETFVRERCVLGSGIFIRTADLLAAYRRWHGERGSENPVAPLGAEEFNRAISAMGLRYRRGRRIAGNQARTFEGIGLKIEATTRAASARAHAGEVLR